ncbi:DMT family transporter [Mycolicibacterium fluoranthenivorans]|uniref:Drug/metabolite transporter (DMT)-like permease n=1 Tax=Mycolicibacterium fluoranthenivorans TaxID=258505 RepID=A0A7X5ZCE5_9MYCO|nr:DMT family transporter [Mycolicibacterium fluoranthenivorans]NIH94994.1 drug/metabolite transporter (DMT)-like permease [Mycolicibacterium fluoranthenivorans]
MLALVSAAGYGVSDFVGGIASRRVAALRVVIVSYPLAMVLLSVLALFVDGHVTGPAVWWGLLCGFCQAFGVWWFYAALGSGPISVVSPLTAILVAGVPVGFGVLMGERPSAVALAGIAVALVAVVLVSRGVSDEDVTEHRFTTKVAWLTVGSGLAFGLNFVVINEAPHDAGLWPLVFARIAASVMVVLIALVAGQLRVPTGVPLWLALSAGVLDTVANIAMLWALQNSLLSLTGVLISLYPAGTVALALLVLKEKVTRWQVVGMVAALAAVAMIAGG